MRLRILEDAEKEAQAAAQWYERHRERLGEEFLAAVSDALKGIEDNPRRFGAMETLKSAREIRRVLLRRFPYAVIYEVRTDEALVLAVAHVRRRPNYWKGREG